MNKKYYRLYNPTLDLIEEVLNEMKERKKGWSIKVLAEEDYEDREFLANIFMEQGEFFALTDDKGFEDLRFRAFLLALARKVYEDPQEQKKMAREAFAQFIDKGHIYIEDYDAWARCFYPTAPGVCYWGSPQAVEALPIEGEVDEKMCNFAGLFYLVYDILDFWKIDTSLTFTYTTELFPGLEVINGKILTK